MVNYLVFFGVGLQLIGSLHYARETLAGRSKPNRVTWFMWASAPLIAALAALSKGASLSVLPVFMAGFGPLLVLLSSFASPNAYWKLEKFDYLCGLFSILALVFWYLTKNPNVAIALSIASDAFAAIPTLVKSWRYPETETVSPYLATVIASIAGLFTIKVWVFSEYAFSIYLIFICITFVTLIWKGKLFQKK